MTGPPSCIGTATSLEGDRVLQPLHERCREWLLLAVLATGGGCQHGATSAWATGTNEVRTA
jgi:hypothetical protein